jgi:hypothetical protein
MNLYRKNLQKNPQKTAYSVPNISSFSATNKKNVYIFVVSGIGIVGTEILKYLANFRENKLNDKNTV